MKSDSQANHSKATNDTSNEKKKKAECPIHGKDCPGDDGGFLIDGNHPDDMFSVGPEPRTAKGSLD